MSMSIQLDSKISEALRNDIFEQISRYILAVCEMLVEDYCKEGKLLPNDENKIRSILLEDYLDADEVRAKFGMLDFCFSPETPENYDGEGEYIGRADIRIKLITDYSKRDAYYLVECKRLDGSNDLNKKYVSDGVARFVTRKYSSYFGKNIMLGFIVKKMDVSDNITKIEKLQNDSVDKQMHGKFSLVYEQKDCKAYRCLYQLREDKLELRHIFTDFAEISP